MAMGIAFNETEARLLEVVCRLPKGKREAVFARMELIAS